MNDIFQKLNKYSKKLQDSKYFDIVSLDVAIHSDGIAKAVRQAAAQRRMKVIEDLHDESGDIIIIAKRTSVSKTKRPEALAALVRQTGASTKFVLKHFSYEISKHDRGVAGAGTKQKGFIRGPQPKDRESAYYDALRLMEEIVAQAKTD